MAQISACAFLSQLICHLYDSHVPVLAEHGCVLCMERQQTCSWLNSFRCIRIAAVAEVLHFGVAGHEDHGKQTFG